MPRERTGWLVSTICLTVLSLLHCSLPVLGQVHNSNQPTPGQPNPRDNSKNQNGDVKVNIPDRGLPGRREVGGTRGPNTCISSSSEIPTLTLLLPPTNLGLTTAAYPRFFWYTPTNKAHRVKFSLYQVNEQTQQDTLVYDTTFIPNRAAGISSLTLPSNSNVPPLAINQLYQWSVSIICNPQDTSPRSMMTVDGWVQRVAINPNVANKLQQISQRDRILVYAEQGLWFDLLSTVADLRTAQPSDTTLLNTWVSLLTQVNLETIAQQPLLQNYLQLKSVPISPSR
ncbi:MAG: DUF928 domain-containing protein [Mojavia pulchra JT2-VF2]|uniref:DUF928 domain-containing protein n=1 Tax=Mojavia pulchra JT2-VF2 TaxID=287848 RepID=A0A951Q4B1_9NOST|nr:DUF928 domain-containing protein [Mojavia pulchra JT2-VF2]